MLFAQKQRKLIMDKLRQTFIDAAKRDLVIDEQACISEICLNHGSTKRKAQEYLRELFDFGFIERTSLGLVLNKKFLPDEKTIEGGPPTENPLEDSGRFPKGIKV